MKLSLALQGGGAHGAFTWGVLDRLLEEPTLEIAGVSGTSAGALNAVALAAGWRQAGREGARASLQRLWQAISQGATRAPIGGRSLGMLAFGVATYLFSPYELNPLDINPLRDLLEELVDLDSLRTSRGPPILVAATQVRTGECRIFREHELTADMVLASACLPQLHHGVEIDGELYWDGGFVSNPPVVELARLGLSRALLVVRINPASADRELRSAAAIRNRQGEIVFGQPLANELAQLEKLRGLARNPLTWLQPELRRLARVDVEVVGGDEILAGLDPTTKMSPEPWLVDHLREEGRNAAATWLQRPTLRAA
jgi:NTE family protein